MFQDCYKFSIYIFCKCYFFFNDTATTEIYTLSLHDALPSCRQPTSRRVAAHHRAIVRPAETPALCGRAGRCRPRSEEHTSELQSRRDLVCRLLLEKKKKKIIAIQPVKKKKQE